MRVLYVSKALHVAAYRSKMRDLAAHVDVHAVMPERWGNAPSEPGDEDRVQRWPALLHGHNHLHVYRAPGRPVDVFRPDLVHIDEEPYSAVTAQYVRTCGRRRVPCVFFAWQNIDKRLPVPFGALRRYVFQHARGAIAGTQEAADVLQRRGYAGPIAVIPQFGVDAERFRPDARAARALREGTGAGEGETVIGFAGRLVEEKGVGDLLEAAAHVPGTRVVIAGDGPAQALLAERAAREDLAGRVHFLGHVPSTRMAGCLAGFDVLVLPSHTTPTWKEQFGRVLVEAMACGVAVVGSDSGEIPRVTGPAGVIVPEGDIAALRDALQALHDRPDWRRELGGRGRARVLEQFTGERIAERTAAFYHEVGA